VLGKFDLGRKHMNVEKFTNLLFTFSRTAAFLALLVPLSLAPRGAAQTSGTGAISGIVSDATGGSVADARILVTSQATGETRTVTSNSRGAYAVPALLPGLYEVQVTRDGFKTLSAHNIKVTVTETTPQDLHLEVGQVSERIMVEGSAEQLQTESSTLGHATTGEQVQDLHS